MRGGEPCVKHVRLLVHLVANIADHVGVSLIRTKRVLKATNKQLASSFPCGDFSAYSNVGEWDSRLSVKQDYVGSKPTVGATICTQLPV